MSGAIIKTVKQRVETESDERSHELQQEEVALLKLLQQRLALAAA